MDEQVEYTGYARQPAIDDTSASAHIEFPGSREKEQ